MLREYALEKHDPTQRAFADCVLTWGRELVVAYKHNPTVGDHRKLQRVPLQRSYLGGSAGSGKSTTVRTAQQHLRLLFQKEAVKASVVLTAYTGVAAFNIGFGAPNGMLRIPQLSEHEVQERTPRGAVPCPQEAVGNRCDPHRR